MPTFLSELERKVRFRLIETATLGSPGAINITPQGTTGSTSYTYKLVATTAAGTTEAGPASTTTTGNSSLSTTNFNRLKWEEVQGATGYKIYRTTAGGSPPTTGLIATLGVATQFDDQGAAGDGSTAPTTSTAGPTTLFWSSVELLGILNDGIRDLWRAIADLKQEHFITVDNSHCTLDADSFVLTNVPLDVHKIYMIEPRDLTINGSNHGLLFKPLPYNHNTFQLARSRDAIDPTNDTIYYAVHNQGSPVNAPIIQVAPKVTSQVPLSIVYVPTLPPLTLVDVNPIPGESDNAVVSWAVAFARAKERDDRSPDPGWLAIYATEKQHLLQSLGLRQYQEPTFADAIWSEYW